jgi:hypothetical protein
MQWSWLSGSSLIVEETSLVDDPLLVVVRVSPDVSTTALSELVAEGVTVKSAPVDDGTLGEACVVVRLDAVEPVSARVAFEVAEPVDVPAEVGTLNAPELTPDEVSVLAGFSESFGGGELQPTSMDAAQATSRLGRRRRTTAWASVAAAGLRMNKR